MPLPAKVTALFPVIIEKIFGKKESQVIEGVVEVVRSKGLKGSKTAQFATGALVGKLLALWVLPLPDKALWALSAVILVEWAVSLWLRVKTRESV